MNKKVVIADEKLLKPFDRASASNIEKDNLDQETIDKHYNKPVRGFAIISDPETGEVIETPNLVLLKGREYLAQIMTQVALESENMLNYKIRYFGVGSGGASNANDKIGPFDNDSDLSIPNKIGDQGIITGNTMETYKYVHDGYHKYILSDGGKIELVLENHNINIQGTNIEIPAYTTLKFTMIIRKDEMFKETMENGPFNFNEAALYITEFEGDIPAKSGSEDSTRLIPNFKTFARFTTMTKTLELKDSLQIEWFILV